MKRDALRLDARVERIRVSVTRNWQALRLAIRAETGLPTEDMAWAAGIAGVAMGLELARRWRRLPGEEGDPEPGQPRD